MDATDTLPLAQLRAVHKRYGAVVALDGLDLQLQRGQVLALLGANGAGKSTAVALMLGLQRPDAGSARLCGQDPQALSARRQAGVMLQSAGLPETLRVGELLLQARGYYPRPRSIADCVALAGLDGLLARRYGGLSGGQQRRVQFAMAICGRPQVLFLDEPSTGLDIEARQGLWQAIRELVGDGCAVLLTTHYLEEAEALADQVAVLQRGRLMAHGSLAQLRARFEQRTIRCRSTLSVAQVGRWPHVRQAVQHDGVLEIVAEPAEPVVLQLLAADPALGELEVRRAGLADAFLAITQEQAA
ncbi:ABC transporter ATP-binding protein [Xanthomonas maliensis]|uniref:ABC transporter ATP-binding protein n=1 Tax=Xanthomonas maliensis TaxID=1321368 RepID=UPI0003999629|nr:ABC transporter ATP-binding protein [Xanthomonas maliensis]KAB7769127.1 ABC transporter ATP-binding protein [Xanthomonas maliensis]